MLIDMYMSDDNKPIGWWLKEVDRLLEQSFEQTLAEDGLTRRQWQALNAAAPHYPASTPQPRETAAQAPDGAAEAVTIGVALAPFLDGGSGELAAVIGPLVERGWLVGQVLTAEGEAARRRLAEKVRAQRRRVMAGISEADYRVTVDVLRRMAGNLT